MVVIYVSSFIKAKERNCVLDTIMKNVIRIIQRVNYQIILQYIPSCRCQILALMCQIQR